MKTENDFNEIFFDKLVIYGIFLSVILISLSYIFFYLSLKKNDEVSTSISNSKILYSIDTLDDYTNKIFSSSKSEKILIKIENEFMFDDILKEIKFETIEEKKLYFTFLKQFNKENLNSIEIKDLINLKPNDKIKTNGNSYICFPNLKSLNFEKINPVNELHGNAVIVDLNTYFDEGLVSIDNVELIK